MQGTSHRRYWLVSQLALIGTLAAVSSCAMQDDAEENVAEEAAEVSVLVNYSVSMFKTGSGAGTLTASPSVGCNASCTGSIAAGTVVTFSASPAITSSFGGWGGSCSGFGTSPTCTLTINSDVTVAANFQQNFYSLSISKVGAGSGTVTSSPGGINCGSTCSGSYPYNYGLNLTATPSATSLFLGWSGGGCSGTGSCFVSMTQARAVTATFVQANPVVSVMKTGSGGGAVFSSPSYITCSPTCSAAVPYGTSLSLFGSAAVSSTFGGWTGAGCSGTGLCTFTVTQDVTIGANFQMNFYALTVSKTGSGTVTSSPSGINCGSTCSASYPHGANVTLTATPTGSGTFTGWGGACSGTGSCFVSMTQASSVTATFSP